MPDFYITLRAARVNRGFTLKDVAVKVNKCTETISRYEADSTDIPRDLSVQLLELYGVPANYIFFGKESSFTGRINKRHCKKTS